MQSATAQTFSMLRFWSKRRKTVPEATAATASPLLTPPSCEVEQLCSKRDLHLLPDNLRLLLAENHRVVFDSKSIIPVEGHPTESIRLSQCKKFQLLRKRRDTPDILKLIWGGGSTHGTDSIKFHQLEKSQILVSRVFSISNLVSRNDSTHGDSLPSSDSESQCNNTVRSTDGLPRGCLSATTPPEQFTRVRNTSLHMDSDDSEELRTFSPPHHLSKNRRIQMSLRTSLSENYCQSGAGTPWKSRSRLSSIGSQLEDDGARNIALGFIFSNDLRTFFFQHISIMESELVRLENRITTAAMHSPSFLENVYKAWHEFCISMCILFNAPRLRNPAWLSFSNADLDDCQVATDFCSQLAHLVRVYDTKHNKFFLSNVITTVLMNHMSWVASVASPHVSSGKQGNEESPKNLLIGSVLNPDVSAIPYNPHMAQFLEISGSVGNMHRNTKVVICGSEERQLAEILQVLSYFIRCSTVKHTERDLGSEPLPAARCFSPIEISPCEIGDNSIPTILSPMQSDASDDGILDVPSRSLALFSNFSDGDSLDSSDFLGRSLLAGPMTTYSPHFVLSGLIKSGNNFEKAFESMCDDVRCEDSAVHRVAATSISSSQSSSSVCEVQLPESVIVLADTNECTVKVLSSDGIGQVDSPSELVVAMLEQFAVLHSAGTAPKFLITFLEDNLFHLLGKSLSLVELVCGGMPNDEIALEVPAMMPSDRVRLVIGCDHSDLRLILNVASVYYPFVLNCVL